MQPENTVKFTVFTMTLLVHGVNCTKNIITAGMWFELLVLIVVCSLFHDCR